MKVLVLEDEISHQVRMETLWQRLQKKWEFLSKLK